MLLGFFRCVSAGDDGMVVVWDTQVKGFLAEMLMYTMDFYVIIFSHWQLPVSSLKSMSIF